MKISLLEWLENRRSELEDGIYSVCEHGGVYTNGNYVKYTLGTVQDSKDIYKVENGEIHLLEEVKPLPLLKHWLEVNKVQNGLFETDGNGLMWCNGYLYEPETYVQPTTDKYKVENGVITLVEDSKITLYEWLLDHLEGLKNGIYVVDGRGVIFHGNLPLHQKQSVMCTGDVYKFKDGNLYYLLGNDEQLVHYINSRKSASDYLEEGAKLLKERGKQYDREGGERSIEKTVNIFNAMTGKELTTVEGWYFMQVLKDVRFFANTEKPHEDSLVDGINYRALMTEEAMK